SITSSSSASGSRGALRPAGQRFRLDRSTRPAWPTWKGDGLHMAQLVGTFFHSHGGTTSMPGELWHERRNQRPIRPDVPIESIEANVKKAARVHEGFRVLREKVAEVKADVLIVFSDDQLEC